MKSIRKDHPHSNTFIVIILRIIYGRILEIILSSGRTPTPDMITILHFTLKNSVIYKIQMEILKYKYNLLDTIYNTKELIPAITCTCKKENDKFIARFN